MKKLTVENFPFLSLYAIKHRVSWSIMLRWLAIFGYFAASLLAKNIFDKQLPYEKIWLTLLILMLINSVYFLMTKIFKEFSFQAEIIFLQFHIIIDLIFLTLILHFSGGIENPIYLFYAFHIVISSIIFPGARPVYITTLVVFLLVSLIYLEYSGILPHYCIVESDFHDNDFMIFIVLTVFTITAYITMYICMTFMVIYRNIKLQIDNQNQQLINAEKQRDQFFRFTSHELKSPVVAIKSSVDSVLKNFASQMDKKAIDLLQRTSIRASQMLAIIRELLEISKNRSRETVDAVQLVDINTVILDILEQQKMQAEEKALQVSTNLTESKLSLYAAVDDIREIMVNLLNNAIRYTRENGTVSIVSRDCGDSVQISVTDSGIGIMKEDQSKIFDDFFRSENAKKEVKIGTGLGLSLVKQIVENYHGKIEVNSELNQGTVFTITLPKERSDKNRTEGE